MKYFQMVVRSPTLRAGASYHVHARDYIEALDLVAERFSSTFGCPRYVAMAGNEVLLSSPSDERTPSIRTIRKWR
jgi:hypothetical protein